MEGPAGPRVFRDGCPVPDRRQQCVHSLYDASSRARNEEGNPVHITNIRRLADGRITFHIGYEYQ